MKLRNAIAIGSLMLALTLPAAAVIIGRYCDLENIPLAATAWIATAVSLCICLRGNYSPPKQEPKP